MAKDKKKHAKKDKVSEDILDVAALSIRKFRKVTKEISKLSSGQKIVGGMVLLAAGLTYLAVTRATPDEQAGDAAASSAEEAADEASPLRVSRKPHKPPKLQ